MASDASPRNPNLMMNLDFNHPRNDPVFNEDDEVDVDDDDIDEPPPIAAPKKLSPFPIDESRKLFQRLWTDEDEIELLQGFLDYNNQRGTNSQHHHDTTAFYDQIKTKLQLDFNKNQLVEKLRRLKKKYRNVVQKIASGKDCVFKSPHDQATFEISKKIWGGVTGISTATFNVNTNVKISPSPDEGGINDEDDDRSPNANLNYGSGLIDFSPHSAGLDDKTTIRSKKRPRVVGGKGVGNAGVPQFNQPQRPSSDQIAPAVATNNMIEETIRNCLSPIFKELLNGVMNLGNGARGLGGLTGLATMPLGSGFGGIGHGGVDLVDAGDEKWQKQRILELEVFSKRLELVQDQIKVQLEELRGKGS